MVNRPIIISVMILMAAGTYRAFLVTRDPTAKHATTITRILVGGYVLAIIASILDLVTPLGARLASLLLALAVTSAAVAILPDLISRFGFSSTAKATKGVK